MPPTDVVVVGVGITTSVGVTAAETAASVRSGVMRFREISILDGRFEPFTVGEVPDDALAPLSDELEAATGLTAREARLLRLGTAPLIECLKPLDRTLGVPPLILSLAEMDTARPIDRPVFLERFLRQTGGAFDIQRSDASHSGRAGGLAAVAHAAEFIRGGHAPFVVAGGIDTYRDAYLLATLDLQGRVKCAAHLDGFIPAEGAAFLLLAAPTAAAAAGRPVLASLSGVSTAIEVGHLYSEEPYRGDGLAAAFGQLAQAGALAQPVREVFSSMNGESHWAKEWGVGYLRTSQAFAPDYRTHHPADCLGDTGAACGTLLVGLAALGLHGGYRRSTCLVYTSSDRGARAAVAVSTAV